MIIIFFMIIMLYMHVDRPGQLSRYSDSQRAEMSGNKIAVLRRFSAPVQTDPGVHPASSTMDNGSFPVVKRSGSGVDHPPHLAPRLKKEQSCTVPLLLLWAFVARSRANFTFTVICMLREYMCMIVLYCVCVCVCVRARACVCVCMYICMYLCMYVFMYTCAYYVRTYVCTYICIE